jgi:hypothetical protein
VQFPTAATSNSLPSFNPFVLRSLQTLLHNGRTATLLESIRCGRFASRRRVYPIFPFWFTQSSAKGTHLPRCYPHPSCLFSDVYEMQISQPLCFHIHAEWGGVPPSSSETVNGTSSHNLHAFRALRNRAHRRCVPLSNRVLATFLFCRLSTGTLRNRTTLLRACPSPFPEQGISRFYSTREERRMPSAAPGIRGVRFER